MPALNPYSASNKRKIAVASRSGTPIGDGGSETPRGVFAGRKSNEALVGAGGEFNAGNKRELMQAISTLHRLFQSGEVEAKYSNQQSSEVRAAQQQRLVEAWNDRSGQSWQALGEVMGDERFVSAAQ